MKRIKVAFILMIFFFLSPDFSLSAQDKIISVGFAPVPPYVMLDSCGAFSGLEYEIINESFAARGYTVKPEAFPLARLIETVKEGGIDVAARILPSHETGRYLSDIYIIFNNIALGLQSSRLKINSVTDLKGKSIVAFQRASIVLGPEFALMTDDKTRYREVANQALQIRMLFAGRADLVIGEARILNYYLHAKETGIESVKPVVEYHLFPETPYRVAFVNRQHKKEFNLGLAEIRQNGKYDEIIQKYLLAP
ncbi:amino acid ABC transporter substrate-binding protein (PAAT family) [Desulfobotulus alkaliphilus]|uniref:Amino acid ABC transporter substrate-binding protein (PAAT family) n=1 Tax=Desulfobotulus alkaliphilus TaxID=622671 RepID=A0A562RQ69_9BACT|nr:transporter substrate-binding domain-containing protein [Desulfobotulus alkaliphilus]TWI71249.1 amino acid ABC transporter substrate-binding protein (PAAT family) [Desulfobotulus alkaliphilus]